MLTEQSGGLRTLPEPPSDLNIHKIQRAHSRTIWIAYVVLFAVPVAIAALALGLSKASVEIIVALVALFALWRGVRISVATDGQVLWVRNFWKTHAIEPDQIARIERRELWWSPLAIGPNSDIPVIVCRDGRAIPVVAGIGGNPKADRIIAALGRGEVPDDGRIPVGELWRRVGRSRLRRK